MDLISGIIFFIVFVVVLVIVYLSIYFYKYISYKDFITIINNINTLYNEFFFKQGKVSHDILTNTYYLKHGIPPFIIPIDSPESVNAAIAIISKLSHANLMFSFISALKIKNVKLVCYYDTNLEDVVMSIVYVDSNLPPLIKTTELESFKTFCINMVTEHFHNIVEDESLKVVTNSIITHPNGGSFAYTKNPPPSNNIVNVTSHIPDKEIPSPVI